MTLRRPPRLWTLLLLSNLAVLTLPVSGLWLMRLYESALVRQTEAELIAQAALWAAAFRAELRRAAPDAVPAPDVTNTALSEATINLLRRPGLDLADDPILPPAPDATPPAQPAEPQATEIGRALAPMIRDAQVMTLSALRLTDARGVVIASTGGDLGRSLAGWEEVAQVLTGAPIATSMRQRDPVQASISSLSRTSHLRVFVALPVQGGSGVAGTVVLSRTPRTLVQAIWGKRWELTALVAVLLGIGVLLAVGLSRLVTRPIAIVVAQAQRAAQGRSIVPLRHPGTREIADLSDALTRMAATLDQRARYISAFAASVSHEFKTPLAGLRGAAELLEDNADTLSDGEARKLLAVISSSTSRLDQLVGRLLELARADMMRHGDGVSTKVMSVLDEVLPRYRAKGMSITVRAGNEMVGLAADALAALLTSLLDNAATHASGAKVSIGIGVSDGRVQITVADHGPGLSPANQARVFDPFFTTGRDRGGTGLGLSIARAIAVGAGGSVELVPSDIGACFRVELPNG